MSQFETFTSESGALSARHCATGILVHSATNPRKEAADAASSLACSSTKQFILVGTGLGYLATELEKFGRLYKSYEPFAELQLVAEECRMARPLDAQVGSAADLERDLGDGEPPEEIEIVIAPYVRSLSRFLDSNVQELTNRLHVISQSRKIYAPIIERNMRANLSLWGTIPRLQLDRLRAHLPAVVIGAGPSLDQCLATLKTCRDDLLLVAASGALPALSAAGVTPDWTIALEARGTALADLVTAKKNQKVVVFPWTDPEVFKRNTLRHFAAEEHMLITDSGSSALTAADLALKLTSGPLFLIGMELTNAQGDYANGVNRLSSDATLPAPKFEIMRSALRRWVLGNPNRAILHVLPDNVAPVSGVHHISVGEFSHTVSTASRKSSFVPIA